MAKRERGEGKKIVLVVRFRDRRVSCIYNRPTKKKEKEHMLYILQVLDYVYWKGK